MSWLEIRSLKQLVMLVAASCFSFGFNTGTIAGALLFLKSDFPQLETDPVLKGTLTASVFFGAFVSNMITGPLADRFGRVPVMAAMNLPFIAGACIVAGAQDPTTVIMGRFITGLAVGIAGTLPNLYIAEIAPPELRGRYVGMAPLFGTIGICAAQVYSFLVALALGDASSAKWRLMFLTGAIPPLLQSFVIFQVPESPRWCIQRGLTERAARSLDVLNVLTGGDAKTQFTTKPDAESGAVPAGRLSLRLAAVAVGLSLMQQLSGVNAVIFYAPNFFADLGVPDQYAILVSACNSLAQVFMTTLLLKLVDSWGRRTMCLIGLVFMTGGMLLLGAVFQGDFSQGHSAAFAVSAVLLYRLAFSLSLGPLPYIMVTELFPQEHRSKGVALSMMVNWFLNTLVVFSVPTMLKRYAGQVFFAFAGVCIVCIVFVDLFLPETSGQSLENIAAQRGPDGFILRTLQRTCPQRFNMQARDVSMVRATELSQDLVIE